MRRHCKTELIMFEGTGDDSFCGGPYTSGEVFQRVKSEGPS